MKGERVGKFFWWVLELIWRTDLTQCWLAKPKQTSSSLHSRIIQPKTPSRNSPVPSKYSCKKIIFILTRQLFVVSKSFWIENLGLDFYHKKYLHPLIRRAVIARAWPNTDSSLHTCVYMSLTYFSFKADLFTKRFWQPVHAFFKLKKKIVLLLLYLIRVLLLRRWVLLIKCLNFVWGLLNVFVCLF